MAKNTGNGVTDVPHEVQHCVLQICEQRDPPGSFLEFLSHLKVDGVEDRISLRPQNRGVYGEKLVNNLSRVRTFLDGQERHIAGLSVSSHKQEEKMVTFRDTTILAALEIDSCSAADNFLF